MLVAVFLRDCNLNKEFELNPIIDLKRVARSTISLRASRPN
jgi:hypothetical protein